MSLKAALARKQRREEHYDVLVDDPSEAEAAVHAAADAVAAAHAEHGEDSAQATAAVEALNAAARALAGCYHRVVFQNLPPVEFEALAALHKPTPEQQKAGAEFNRATFAPALLAACAVDSDLDEAGWAAEFDSGRWAYADRQAIFAAALSVNARVRSPEVPKG